MGVEAGLKFVHQIEDREKITSAMLKSRSEAEAFVKELERSLKEFYPSAKVKTFSHGFDVNFEARASFKFPYSAYVNVACKQDVCDVEGFVGWPPETLKDDFDAYVIGQPECQVFHDRLIENASVLECRAVGLDEALRRFVEISSVILARADELKHTPLAESRRGGK